MTLGTFSNIKKVKWFRYRPGVAQRVDRGIALLFHDRRTRKGWVVSSTPRPHFTPGKDPVPILQEAGWAPGPVWTGGKSRPQRDSIPDRPARSQSPTFSNIYNNQNNNHTGTYVTGNLPKYMRSQGIVNNMDTSIPTSLLTPITHLQ